MPATPNLPAATAPAAAQRPTRIEHHGDVRVDEYFWLRERENPEVIAHLEAENTFTNAVMAHTETLQEQLFQEMRGRIKETDVSAPLPRQGYFYYQRTFEGKNYPVCCRRRDAAGSTEEVLLDVNQLAEGHAFTAIGGFSVSPDQRLLAYALDTEGNEAYTIFVKDLTSGELLPDRIANTYYGLEWGNDNRTIFYTTLGEAHRPEKVWRHQLGDSAAADVMVLHEPDARYFVGIAKTRSGRFIVINLESNMTAEVWVVPADAPESAPAVVLPRRQGHEYEIDHRGDFFYIRTNDQARNFRVVAAPVADPSPSNWVDVVAHSPLRLIDGLDAFQDALVVYAREDALRTIHILGFAADGQEVTSQQRIEFPEAVYTYRRAPNFEFDSHRLFLSYASLRTPPTVYAYDMIARSFEVIKQDEIAGYNPDDYVTARVWATAEDGVRVPISIVHHRTLLMDGDNPTWLYGYGSYGSSSDPYFNSNRISLLERGFVFAIAHVRGGSEMGRHWYEDGKLLKKKNTFTDFVACAQALIEAEYTNPAQLVAAGRSAGGLLMGAITNLRPDLFKAVIAGVPFVDVINTMLDPSIPLTVMEYEEWGNPEVPEEYAYMRSYSPYDNLEAKSYPWLLATAGLNDPRVQYWEPAKYVARLRTLKTDGNPLLLKTNMAAGHGGASGRYDYLREVAFEYAFFLAALDMTEHADE